MSNKSKPARREFLRTLGATSALGLIASPLTALQVEAQQMKPAEGNKWDVSWTDRVNGKFKAIFDSPKVEEGAGLFRACIWRDQHKAVYGTPHSDTSAVLVIRHAAMALIMDDEYWARFNVGKDEKMKDPATKKWTKINPIRVAPPGASGSFKDYNLVQFMADGGIVLGCGLAFQQVVSKFREADKLSREDADKKAREHLVPGVILQPSGIFAALRAQEMGCNYFMAV